MESSILLPANNSDHEDFVSFPTLPDPNNDNNNTLSNIFTKTLRKVTNNATNLVQNYSPRAHEHPEGFADHQEDSPIRLPTLATSMAEPKPSRTAKDLPDVTEMLRDPKPAPPVLHIASEADPMKADNASQSTVNVLGTIGMLTPAPDDLPRVRTDARSLRFSNGLLSVPKLQPAALSGSVTSSVVNVNAIASTDTEAINHMEKPASGSEEIKVPDSSKDSKSSKKTLQTKISNMFNNLPNDIELSEDSASDLDTINDMSTNSLPSHHPSLPNKSGSIPPPELYMYSDSVVKSSPIRAQSYKDVRTNESSPTLNSFYALKNYNNTTMKKKPSSKLSTAILDNAKSLINHNFSGAITSASSLYGDQTKKKRRKHKKVSENPLKSGGIPKKYWMNDSFVSECLNCFKPFSAFRRKHHCRFCGQIFCSECTLFVSYTQHKEERRSGALQTAKKHYNDKLRVCKPCYSDVIVYLSDSDSSSSSKSDEEDTVSLTTTDKLKSEESLPHHPLARVRTLSMSSSAREDVRSFSHKASGPEFNALERLPSNTSPNLKTPLQLSIPTTRVGESMEIPLSRSMHNNASFLNASVGAAIPTSYEAANKHWLKKSSTTRRAATPVSSSLPKSASVDNISFLSGGKLSRIKSHAEDSNHNLRSKPSMDMDMSDSDFNEDEFESENEDEQVMSLYTSLNHNGYANGSAKSAISPRAPIGARSLVPVSAGVVPTLGEFPTMMVNEKLFPKSGAHPSKGSAVLPKFIANGNHSHSYNDVLSSQDSGSPLGRNAAFLEDNPKSDIRSHERAHASLLRMRSRRRTKTGRNVSLLTQNNAKLPLLDFSDVRESISPISSPTSPTPTPAPGYLKANSDDTIVQHSTNHGILSGNLERFDPAMMTVSDQYSANDMNDEGNKSIVTQNSKSSLLSGERKLDDVYDDIFDKILNQCFNDCDIKEDTGRWSAALKRVLSNVNDLRMTDTLDIKQYVKLKRIAGGLIEKTDIVDGIYITKNIDSKRMPKRIQNPRIALLMFPIEYLKQKEQFISLRIVQSQQSVYITNLVSRLISLGPDVIVVGDSVCQLAEKLLEEANITVISNTKPQVIERISRYTKADIFQSVNDLFFKKGSLGRCGLFEVKKSLYGLVLKSFVCFTGTDRQLGITIALRGGNDDVLNSIKYAAETLLPLQINMKFEKSYFCDQFLVYLDDQPHDKVRSVLEVLDAIKQDMSELETKCGITLDENEVVNYLDLFLKRYISVSPASKFCFPPQLYNVLEAFINYYRFFKSNLHLLQSETIDNIDARLIEEMRLNLDIDVLPQNKDDLLMFMKVACDARLKLLQTQYQVRARTWSNYMKLPSYQLYPLFHKNIHVLYSNVSIKNNTPCIGPKIFVIDYYTDNDKCLGLHLDQMFGDAGNDCEECGDYLINHYRNYVHGDGKIDMMLEKYDSIPEQHLNLANQRVMWSVCKECGYTSPVVPMKDSTYYYSLGKFFEVCFWGKNAYLNNKCDCKHDFFKSHVRYFGFNDMAIKVQYTPIANYEILVPKKQIEYDVSIDINLKVETLETVRAKISRFFQSVSNRLNRVKVDTFDKAEDGAKQIAELKVQLEKQIAWINDETMKIYTSTPATSYLPLNSILRELQELGVLWDTQFNEFETKFLPSENDITRITQFHLRNFLIDRYSDEDTKDTESDKSKPPSRTPESQNEIENPDETKFLPKVTYDPNSNVGRKVSQMEALLEQERQERLNDKKAEERKISTTSKNSISTSPTLNHKASAFSIASENSALSMRLGKAHNKVTQLTSFFDQMSFDQISQEFRKQRERELQKNLNKYRAIPIVASKPVVEIYNKIEDVVDNNEDIEPDKKDKNVVKRPTDLLKQDSKSDDVSKMISLAKQEEDDNIQQIVKYNEKEKEKVQDKLADELPQPEKVSLLKSLTNFWADRSASLWDPLEYPLDSTEHTFADSDIIVREDEPSSLVALCLSTNDYKQKIKSLIDEFDAENDKLVSNEVTNKKISNFAKIERKFKARFDNSKKPSDLEIIMTKNKSTHLKYQFVDGTTVFSCKIFYSEQFDALRKSCGKVDKFIQSMSRCIKWNSTGGKSGSNFLKTLDNRYIVKELSKSELDSFVSMAPFYFKYISQSMFNTLSTALAKIFGIYQVSIKSTVTGKVFKMDFLIMENLFYNLKTTRIFDLKGSMSNRHVTQTGREDEVLLDENMIEYIYESPVFVKEHLKRLLRGSLFNDTSFLSAMDVMDYSLIIGINDSTEKLNIGIIDWLRTFTWDKKVENWVKGNNLIGGGKKGKDPTIVTPKQYRIRFREAMERYILEVPDIWYEGTKSV